MHVASHAKRAATTVEFQSKDLRHHKSLVDCELCFSVVLSVFV